MLNKIKPFLLSVLSGAIYTLCFPRFDLSFLIWVTLIPLFYALEDKDLIRSFLLAYIAGFTMSIGQFWWLSGAHPAAPFIAATIFATYVGFFGLIYRFIDIRFPKLTLLTVPSVWVCAEFSRTFGALAFPVGLLGYSQYNFLPVAQFADIGGVYGLSFVIAFAGTAIYLFIKNIRSQAYLLRNGLLIVLFFWALLDYGYYRIEQFKPISGNTFKIAVIQPDIDYYSQGIDPVKSLDVVDRLTGQAAAKNPDLIVWPEAIIKGPSLSNPKALEKIFQIVNKYDNYILYGTPRIEDVEGNNEVFSSVILKSPRGKEVGLYNKQRLFPFADSMTEYLTLIGVSKGVFPYSPGSEFTLFQTSKAVFGATICFDGLFPSLVSHFASQGAQFLVNVADDSWSSSEIEHYQHASMSILRAIENRIYYTRVANSGISMVIRPDGSIAASLPPFTSGFVMADIIPNNTLTFYNIYGDFVAHLSLAVVALLSLLVLFSSLFELKRPD